MAEKAEVKEAKTDVQMFLDSLSNRERESVDAALSDWVSECCERKIQHIDALLKELKESINKVNRKREYLSVQLELSSAAMKVLDARLAENSGSLELLMLKDVIATKVADLRREIHVLKPDHNLKKKAEIRREREVLLRRRDIALAILRQAKKGGNGK